MEFRLIRLVRSIITLTKIVFFVLLISIPSSCLMNSSNSSSPIITPTILFFPVQMEEYTKYPYPLALVIGNIILDNGYIRLSVKSQDSNLLLIFPASFSFRIDNNKIQIIDNNNNSIFTIGDTLEVTGGEVPVEIVEKYTGHSIPSNCQGPFFLVAKLTMR